MNNQKNNNLPQTQGKTLPMINSRPNAKNERQKAEEKEVAGRHKNDGQKDHKGAR